MVRSEIWLALRLTNVSRFTSGLAAAREEVAAFRHEVALANTAGARFAAVGHLGKAGMFALGSAVDLTARGLGYLTAATIGFGFQFNSTMDQNTIAFTKFMGSASAARSEVNHLFNVARETPFQFSNVTTAAKQLMAFGFGVRRTNSLIRTFADSISYLGGGTDEINRIVKAFGEINARGKLMSRQLLQLTNLGIPAYQILQKQLGLTQKQIENIGTSGIDAQTAINALQRGLNERFGGGAAAYTRTFRGQIEKLRDSARQTAGALTRPLYDFARSSALPAINKWLIGVTSWANKNKSGISNVFKNIGGAISGAFHYVVALFKALAPAKPFWDNVLKPFLQGLLGGIIGGIAIGFKLLIPMVKILASGLGFLGTVLKPLSWAFKVAGIIIGFLFGGEVADVLSALGKFSRVARVLGGVLDFLMVPFRIIGSLLGTVAGWIDRLLPSFSIFGGVVRTKIVSAFKSTFLFLGRLPAGIGNFIMRIGIKIGDFLFVGMRKRLIKVFLGAVGLAASLGRSIANWLNAHTPFGDTINIGFTKIHIPKLAGGGIIPPQGAVVGEEGPEYAHHTARGVMITPLQRRGGGKSSNMRGAPAFARGSFRLVAPVNIGRRQVGEAVFEYVTDRMAKQ